MSLPNPYEMQLADIRAIIREEMSGLKHQEREFYPGIDLTVYISLKSAAEQLGIASQTLWTHKSKIGFSKQFGQIFFKKEDLKNYIETGKEPVKSKIMFTRKKAA